jgi:hypothetical protein
MRYLKSVNLFDFYVVESQHQLSDRGVLHPCRPSRNGAKAFA